MMLNAYRDMLKAEARARALAGESQTAIAKALGVDQPTVSRWLKADGRAKQLMQDAYPVQVMQDALPTSTPPRYLVVQGTVEKFQPPEGVTFPLIIADPPWNVSDVGHIRERKVRPRPFTKDFGPWDAFTSDKAYLSKTGQWLEGLYQVAAPDAWLFFWCSYRYISHILRRAETIGWRGHTFYAWHKTNPMQMFGNNNYVQALEIALVLARGTPRFHFPGKQQQPHNFMESPQVAGLERVKSHDGSSLNLAQKPLSLCRLWVEHASRPGDWVLDAFAGTGSATIAILSLGRNACAVEADRALAKTVEARVFKECPLATPL